MLLDQLELELIMVFRKQSFILHCISFLKHHYGNEHGTFDCGISGEKTLWHTSKVNYIIATINIRHPLPKHTTWLNSTHVWPPKQYLTIFLPLISSKLSTRNCMPVQASIKCYNQSYTHIYIYK